MNSSLDSVDVRLKAFFQQFTDGKIKDSTQVNNDLQLVVSEMELMIRFFKKEFRIELKGEDLRQYFLEEFDIPFQYTYYKIFKPWKLKKPPLTVRHLVEVCRRGFWFVPSESSD